MTFNEKLVDDPRVVCVLTTIRDGVTLIRSPRRLRPASDRTAVLDYHLHSVASR